MTTIEKKILAVMAVITIFAAVSLYATVSAITEAGGVKQVIIEAGKEIKDISNEIDKD